MYILMTLGGLGALNFSAERGVFKRERASSMYCAEVYPLAFFITEVPWVAFLVWCSITVRTGRGRCHPPVEPDSGV